MSSKRPQPETTRSEEAMQRTIIMLEENIAHLLQENHELRKGAGIAEARLFNINHKEGNPASMLITHDDQIDPVRVNIMLMEKTDECSEHQRTIHRLNATIFHLESERNYHRELHAEADKMVSLMLKTEISSEPPDARLNKTISELEVKNRELELTIAKTEHTVRESNDLVASFTLLQNIGKNNLHSMERATMEHINRAATFRDEAQKNFCDVKELRKKTTTLETELKNARAEIEATRAELAAEKTRVDELKGKMKADEVKWGSMQDAIKVGTVVYVEK